MAKERQIEQLSSDLIDLKARNTQLQRSVELANATNEDLTNKRDEARDEIDALQEQQQILLNAARTAREQTSEWCQFREEMVADLTNKVSETICREENLERALLEANRTRYRRDLQNMRTRRGISNSLSPGRDGK